MGSQAKTDLKGSPRLGSYLRRLRTGYGYSLRRVEEQARAGGGEIDNSQLSRYEKGICYPSFDKLRILANVFNVSIQSFSDVVDLESFEELKPDTGEPKCLLAEGIEALRAGDNGLAFALLEKALETLLDEPPSAKREELIARVRVNQATALKHLGKLSLAEQELRNALRSADRLGSELHVKALLALASIHGSLGDNFLSEMEAERGHKLAVAESMDQLAAKCLHTMARVLADQGRHAQAIERYREAARLYAECGEAYESIRVRLNVATCYVALGKTREGIRLLRSSINEARSAGHRRMEAQAWSNLGEAYYRLQDFHRSRSCFRESDTLAIYNNEKQPDILFFNAYYEWQTAMSSDNPTREKMAFGRLKVLRSSLERRFPEVEAFDEYVERGRANA